MSGANVGQLALPRPGPVVTGTMIAMGAIWLVASVGLKWFELPTDVFLALTGSTGGLLQAELWRLLTAPWLTVPGSISSIAFSLLAIYFFAGDLERRFGGRWLFQFMVVSGAFAYLLQAFLLLSLPPAVRENLVIGAGDAERTLGAPSADIWFGPAPMLDALVIAFAVRSPNAQIRLYFLIPVSARTAAMFLIGGHVLLLLATPPPWSGAIAPFGGILAGYLFGDAPSPVRRWWLQRRLRQLDREAAREAEQARAERREKLQRLGLRVVPRDEDDPPMLH